MKKQKYLKKKKIRSFFTAVFAQKGVFPLMSFFRGQFLDYKDAVCCVCFKILI